MKKNILSPKRLYGLIMIACGYLGLTALALDSLLINFTTHLPGTGKTYDYAIFYWNFWWMKYALIEMQVSPLVTNMMVHPFTHSLLTHTLAPFWGLVSIPLQSFLAGVTIFNLFVFFSFLLTALFTFLFVYEKGVSAAIAFLTGLVFAFTPSLIHRATEGHLNMLPMWWIPLTLWLFDRLRVKQRWATTPFLALVVYGGLLTDYQYMLWIPLILVPYALYHFITADNKVRKWLVQSISVSLLLFAILSYGYPLQFIADLPLAEYPKATLETAHAYSLPLDSLWTTPRADFSIGRLLIPLTIVLAIVGGVRSGNWLWVVIGLGTFVLALGPYWEVGGNERLWLPYLWLHKAFNGFYRAPVRFAVLSTFTFAVFNALALQSIVTRWELKPIVVNGFLLLLGFLFVVDYNLHQPFPSFSLPHYKIYESIAADENAQAILEVPLGVDTGYTLYGHGQQLIFYQPVHQKAILNGALSRMPLTAVHAYEEYDLLNAIAGRTLWTESAINELNSLIELWGIAYITIHLDLLSATEQETLPPFFVMHPALCFWQREDALVAFRVNLPDNPCLQSTQIHLDLGTEADVAHVGSGWYLPEDVGGASARWTGVEPEAKLRFDLEPATYILTFEAVAYPQNQQLTIMVNDAVLGELNLSNSWAVYEVIIPEDVLQPNEPTIITLAHTQSQSAYEQTGGISSDERPLSAAYKGFSLEPVSE